MLIVETMVLFAVSDQTQFPLNFQEQVVVSFVKMDDSKTMDRGSASIYFDHNRDRFAPSIECNTVLDGDVHQLHLDAEEICILYDGLVVTQIAAGRRYGSTLLSSCNPVLLMSRLSFRLSGIVKEAKNERSKPSSRTFHSGDISPWRMESLAAERPKYARASWITPWPQGDAAALRKFSLL